MKQGFQFMADNKKKPIDLSSIENFEIETCTGSKNKVIQAPTIAPSENREKSDKRRKGGRKVQGFTKEKNEVCERSQSRKN